MNTHTVILHYTPKSIRKFFDTIERLNEKIYRGEDYSNEIKKITNDSTEIPRGLQGKYRSK